MIWLTISILFTGLNINNYLHTKSTFDLILSLFGIFVVLKSLGIL